MCVNFTDRRSQCYLYVLNCYILYAHILNVLATETTKMRRRTRSCERATDLSTTTGQRYQIHVYEFFSVVNLTIYNLKVTYATLLHVTEPLKFCWHL